MSKQPTVELFTPEEHLILSEWLQVQSLSDTAPSVQLVEALQRIGVISKPGEHYSRLDAAVAFILLEPVESGLPQWGSSCDGEVELARDYRSKELIHERRVKVVPRHLFTLNWADGGPGMSWPCAYYVTWVPLYDRYVVTASTDSPEMFGYCDLALGHFGDDEEVVESSGHLITRDWRRQRDRFNQGRWAYIFYDGVVNEEQANRWADAVWKKGEQW